MQELGENRVPPLLLELIKITDGISFFDSASPGSESRFVEHTLCESGLARTGVTKQDYILDVKGVKASHGKRISS
jgi:hypothetical protein